MGSYEEHKFLKTKQNKTQETLLSPKTHPSRLWTLFLSILWRSVFFPLLLLSHQCSIRCLLNIWAGPPSSSQQQNVAVTIMKMF